MLLDTYAWIEFFNGTEKGKRVQALIRDQPCYTSAISLAEISEWLEKQQFERFTKLATIKHTTTVLELDHSILEQAGILKVQKRKTAPGFGLIDAIILATAKIHQLPVVTGDPHFKNENIVQL